MVINASDPATAKNAALRQTSFHSTRPRRHHAMPISTKGSGAAAVLLNNASTNAPMEIQYQRLWFASSNFKYDSSDSAKKKNERVFFNSAIHATDATLTGCSAKIAAASHAPGTFKRNNTRQSRIALDACSSTFVT